MFKLEVLVIVTDFVRTQPKESVMVTAYVPVTSLVAVAVVCTGVVFQL